MLDDVHTFAEEKGLKFGFVELHREPLETLARSGVAAKIGSDMIFEDYRRRGRRLHCKAHGTLELTCTP
jgi:hypothetical protein